jgi:PhnB protein
MPQAKPIPDGYHSVQAYLIFKNCSEAIAFYTRAFGAKEKLRMPNAEGRIQHAEIQIGDSVLMMADEAPAWEAFSVDHFGGDAMYAQALRAGAESQREPADQPYGDRMAGVKDPFGYRWYIATHTKDMSAEEMSASV